MPRHAWPHTPGTAAPSPVQLPLLPRRRWRSPWAAAGSVRRRVTTYPAALRSPIGRAAPQPSSSCCSPGLGGRQPALRLPRRCTAGGARLPGGGRDTGLSHVTGSARHGMQRRISKLRQYANAGEVTRTQAIPWPRDKDRADVWIHPLNKKKQRSLVANSSHSCSKNVSGNRLCVEQWKDGRKEATKCDIDAEASERFGPSAGCGCLS